MAKNVTTNLARKKSASKERILPKEDDDVIIGIELFDDLFRSARHTHQELKGVLGSFGGIIAGGVLLAILWYFYGFQIMLSVYIAAPFAFLFTVGMAISVHCRCIIFLLLPNIVSKYGRWILYSLIITVIVSGPIMNINTNMERLSTSMACSAEMIKNQTRDLKQQFADPFNTIKEQFKSFEKTLKGIATDIQNAMKPITDAVEATKNGLATAGNYLKKASDECIAMFTAAYNKCKEGINYAYNKCKSAIDKIPIVGRRKRDVTGIYYDIEEEVFEEFWRERMEEILKEAHGRMPHRKKKTSTWEDFYYTYDEQQFKFHRTVFTEEEEYFHFHKTYGNITRKYRNQTIDNDYGNTSKKRSKRALFSWICEPLNIGAICDLLKLVQHICDPVTLAAKALTAAANGLQSLFETLVNLFEFDIIDTWYLSEITDATKTAAALVAEIASQLSFNTAIASLVLEILSKSLALLLVVMLIQTAAYLHSYLSKTDYDNLYISRLFKKYDKECQEAGKAHLLPLKKTENIYIDTHSVKMKSSELSHVITSFFQLILYFILCATIVFFDFVLYYILYLVHTYGNVNIDVSGSIVIKFAITGDGTVAKFLRSLVTEINVNDTYATNYNITECLPNPSYPDTTEIYKILALHGAIIVLIFMQAYGYRTRRFIASYYYPERENERMRFLHCKILHNRQAKVKWMRPNIKHAQREKRRAKNRAIPLLGKLMGTDKKSCLNCGTSFTKDEKFYTCSTLNCYADYCEECFNDMGRVCLLCHKDKLKVSEKEGHTSLLGDDWPRPPSNLAPEGMSDDWPAPPSNLLNLAPEGVSNIAGINLALEGMSGTGGINPSPEGMSSFVKKALTDSGITPPGSTKDSAGPNPAPEGLSGILGSSIALPGLTPTDTHTDSTSASGESSSPPSLADIMKGSLIK